jgi:hypothetical protein
MISSGNLTCCRGRFNHRTHTMVQKTFMGDLLQLRDTVLIESTQILELSGGRLDLVRDSQRHSKLI